MHKNDLVLKCESAFSSVWFVFEEMGWKTHLRRDIWLFTVDHQCIEAKMIMSGGINTKQACESEASAIIWRESETQCFIGPKKWEKSNKHKLPVKTRLEGQ